MGYKRENEKLNSDIVFKREYAIDNLRCVLIFLVVFAHFLEGAAPFSGSNLLYKVIYSFHMPAMIFLFGYFSKYNPKRILFHWVIPYMVFQTIYILFSKFILNVDKPLQYFVPYWLLWFMMTCMVYQMLLPFYLGRTKKGKMGILVAAIVLALAAGYVDWIGYGVSLSRSIVFLPWFLFGVFYRENVFLQDSICRGKRQYLLYGLSVLFIVLSILFIEHYDVSIELLYGSYSYQRSGNPMWMRGILMLIAFFWIVFLWMTSKLFFNKKIGEITTIGQNTLPIYLLHGFIVRAIPIFSPELVNSPWKVVLLSGALLVLFGNRYGKTIVYYISLSWLEKEYSWKCIDLVHRSKKWRKAE